MYWKIPLGGKKKYRPMSSGGKGMKRGMRNINIGEREKTKDKGRIES
jgi:hypothetical protein